MRNLVLFMFISGFMSVQAQVEQTIHKTSGSITQQLSDIDSIRFGISENEMQIIMSNGSAFMHRIEDIINVTFSSIVPGSISSLDCPGAIVNGSLVKDVNSVNVSFEIEYLGGNGGVYQGDIANSIGVTGLTAVLDSGIFSNGNGTLIYNIFGTPSNTGVAIFILNIGGRSCALTIDVEDGLISTLDCQGAIINGNLVQNNAATGVTAEIGYTGGNGGPYIGQTINSVGVTGLTATFSGGNFSIGNGTLICSISGTPIANGPANFIINLGGEICTLVVNVGGGSISSLDCLGSILNGSLTEGVSVSAVTLEIDYAGGNGGPHNGQTVNSTGVLGLTATLLPGTFNLGAGTLVYVISGTPATNGIATFSMNIGGISCSLSLNVEEGLITSLNCSGVINNGSLVQNVQAGSNVTSTIIYAGGNGGPYAGISVSSTGVTGLTATLNSGNFNIGAGTLQFTITGTPSSNGVAVFSISIGGESCSFSRSIGGGSISSLNCGNATINGSLTQGTPASGVSALISYSGGNSGPHNGQTVNSTGVLGLTATLNPGNFASGSGTLTYIITGTPTSSGSASFIINVGGRSCTLTLNVAGGSISSLNCTGASINGSFVEGISVSGASIVINYTGGNGGPHTGQVVNSTGVVGLTATLSGGNFSTGFGTLNYSITGTPNSSGIANFSINIGSQSCVIPVSIESGLVSSLNCVGAIVNGSLTEGTSATGVTVDIGYIGGNGGPHNGQVVNSTGVTGLTATLSSGNFLNGNGILNYSISGTPNGHGSALFAINIGNATCSLTIPVTVNILLQYPPNSVFCASGPAQIIDVTNPSTGKIWMDRNLGASRVAQSSTDAQAYGDLYQWGRRSDGHQCRTSSTTTTISSFQSQPNHGNFIINTSFPWDWRNPQTGSLWQGQFGTNNPCPTGYRLPTNAELIAERVSWNSSNANGAFASSLKLTRAGGRSTNGILVGVNNEGNYWSSTEELQITPNGTHFYNGSWGLTFSVNAASNGYYVRSSAQSIRCIKN